MKKEKKKNSLNPDQEDKQSLKTDSKTASSSSLKPDQKYNESRTFSPSSSTKTDQKYNESRTFSPSSSTKTDQKYNESRTFSPSSSTKTDQKYNESRTFSPSPSLKTDESNKENQTPSPSLKTDESNKENQTSSPSLKTDESNKENQTSSPSLKTDESNKENQTSSPSLKTDESNKENQIEDSKADSQHDNLSQDEDRQKKGEDIEKALQEDLNGVKKNNKFLKTSTHHEILTSGSTKVFEDEDDTIIMQKKSAKKSPASLILLNGPKDLIGLSWPLIKNVTSVGRSKQLNDICIKYKSLSKKHFKLIKKGEQVYIVDLKSTNKTYINDELADPYEKLILKNNYYIRASNLVFKFLGKGSLEFLSSMQMLNKAQTDPLTGAGNRNLLKIKGNEYFFSKSRLSLIVFDIDNFKEVNDKFGHMAGDHILKSLSEYVLSIIREGDIFIRYGGDEFCIFTPNTISVAENITLRIKDQIKKNTINYKGQNISISLSTGISEKFPTDQSWEDIYHRADELSYREKKIKKTMAQ